MVGIAAREEGVAPPPSGNAVVAATCAAILPRRILFHPPLKTPLPTSSSLALTPLNLSPPPVSSSTSAVLEDPSHLKSSLYPTTPLPSIRIQRIGAGLNNLGNTCFLNAVLQCLTYTPPLAAYFQAGHHQSSCRSVGFCAMCALERHVKQALSAQGRVISPNLLVKNLRCISRSFQMGRQEDAHEYMRYLIEALQKSCPVEAHANTASSSYRNFIQRIFGGRLRSQVKCSQCSQSSNTYDPFLDLSLDIVKAESLLKALARFTAIEVLDGDNKYHCCKCKAKVRAHKQFTIDIAPHVLTVQFKRFSSSGGYGGKIDKKVQFDRSFNLKAFVNGGKEGGLRYSLYAVLVHSGWSTHSGHYFCFVRTSTDIWHRLDDNRVSQVSEKVVLEQKAYILFYVRDTEVLPISNGNDHGIRSERFLISNGTSNVAKRAADDMPIHKDTAQLKGGLCIVNNKDNHTARSSSSTVTTDVCNNIPGVQNKVEVLANGNMARASASSVTKACNPAPAGVIENYCSAKVEPSGVHSLFNGHLGNNNVSVLNNGKAQMNGYTNGLSPRSQAKLHTLASAKTESHLPNDMQVAEDACLTEKNRRKNEIFHNEINGNGSAKHISLTIGKNAEAKVEKLQRPERQVALCSTERAKFALSLSNSTSFEMAVPRWEEDAEERKGINVEDQIIKAETVAHCGHVLDEWDEEYDRGKRKKTRRREEGKHGIAEVSESLHIHKKRKKLRLLPREHSSTAIPTSNGDCNGNAFQAFAGKRAKPGLDTARLKKSRKRQRDLGHKFFLKRHRFKQLHNSCQRRRRH